MNGEDIPRKLDERPDFLRYVPPENKHSRGTVVGIEHFLVDHVSEPRRKSKEFRLQSCTRPFQKDARSLYENYHDIVNDQGIIPDDLPNNIGSLIARHLAFTEQATFPLFMQSFQQGLEKHSREAVDYMHVIRKEAQKRNSDCKLFFLIEILTEFPTLFLHADGRMKLVSDKTFVLFEQIISLLEKTDKQVDYVVLCAGDPLFTHVQTIAFKTQNIRAELKKRHMKSYFYCGHDVQLPVGESFVKEVKLSIRSEQDDEKILFTPELECKVMDPAYVNKFVCNALRAALYFSRNHIPFVVNTVVEYCFEKHSTNIVGWKKSPDDNWSYVPILAPGPQFEDDNQSLDLFFQKWGLKNTL